jgi:flagellar biosynthesis protein FlhF
MKIRRFTGTDMRDAMRQVREALGANAVILETARNAADTGVTALLAVPANAASSAMQEIVDAFRTAQPAGCILTKTDEATSLGGALSILIRSGLPLACVANGQRVPEDLYLMRNRQTWLTTMAVELMRRDSRVIGADTLARNFSEVATHAYA